MNTISIVDMNVANAGQLGLCGYKNPKKEGFAEKLAWLQQRLPEGLKIKTLYSEKDGSQGMIEYVAGERCWRPVSADGYLFIHCLFVGFKSVYKNKGYAGLLLEECIRDAKKEKMYGLATVTRKGSFMTGKEFFIKHGFEVLDSAKPDFELLVKRFSNKGTAPGFKTHVHKTHADKTGLVIMRSDQCPYTVKNVKEIIQSAQEDFDLQPQLIHLANYKEAQKNPCPFGTFSILFDGVIIAEHPISKGRFVNIMKKLKK